MHLLHLSDSHNQHRSLENLPEADIIVHSGDFSFAGTRAEFLDFLNWFLGLDYQHKIFIGGNHDYFLEGKSQKDIQKMLPKNCHYLFHSGVTIENIKFWGVPMFVSEDIDGSYFRKIKRIPKNTDILISHNPPFGILDLDGKINFVCKSLGEKIVEIKPKFHLFGHIHNAFGIEKSKHTTFSNASILNGNYEFQNLPNIFVV
ncbi:metallophosphatase domain-containing protein [Moheibacter lacus]|uniref:Metallophosphatase domain-containing protein n=1 Tax=Moheibacter lacus TaxID=2745851 RepID=A0A838ZNW5_9FLAO|nr:metallophosphatase domain-containing protein [Moheibacter lacus]MBA5628987.1 metallophosphatase domain-containing protein [Moheibacter lacus]